MSSSHTRIITLTLAVALLALPATPALATPGGGPGATQDSGFFGLSPLWAQLTNWFGSVFDRPDGSSGDADAPKSIFDQLGPLADPGGTPSTDSEDTTSTVSATDDSDSEAPTG